jgi:hypothetical protein
MPNEGTDEPLSAFVVSVDEVERQTGIDFFSKVEEANSLESVSNAQDWRKLASWRRESQGARPSRRKVQKPVAGGFAPSSSSSVLTFGTSAHELKAKERYERAPDKGPCWLSINSDKRHNSNCKHFEKSRGRHCEKTEGTPAGCCGG